MKIIKILRTELPWKHLKNEKIHKFSQNVSALIFLVLFNFLTMSDFFSLLPNFINILNVVW